jgi:hypothetical protein
MIEITDEMVEKAADPLADLIGCSWHEKCRDLPDKCQCWAAAKAAISAAAPLIAAAEREECAKLVEKESEAWGGNYRATQSTYDHARSHVLREMADLIRARGNE